MPSCYSNHENNNGVVEASRNLEPFVGIQGRRYLACSHSMR